MTDLDIFHNAPDDASPEELAAFLDEACGDDAGLRARVEALFALEEPTLDFLEQRLFRSDSNHCGDVRAPRNSPPSADPPIENRKKKKAPFSVPSVEEVNRALPEFEVEEFLGSGGMGAVFKARQKQLKRVVAIKILPSDLGGESHYVERFKREARAMAQLSHPNIVTVFDFGIAPAGFQFISMEYVEGKNLSAVIAAGNVTTQQCLDWIRQVCDALAYAHSRGVIHRDIKPANILIDQKGNLKVADFGLAKLVDPRGLLSDLTKPHSLLGTPAYMSPEALESSAAIDHRADIYAIGVLLYQILTGVLPRGSWELPSKLVDVDRRFDGIIDRAMKPTPIDRYQDASDISTELEAIENTPAWKAGPGARRVRFKFPNSEEGRQAFDPGRVRIKAGVPVSRERGQRLQKAANSNLPVATVVESNLWLFLLILSTAGLLGVGYFLFTPIANVVRQESLTRADADRQELVELAAQDAPKGGIEEIELALKFLGDEKASARDKEAAFEVLVKLEGRGVDATILNALEKNVMPFLDIKLSRVLADRGCAEAVPAMMTVLTQSNSESGRADILESIRRVAGPESTRELLDALARKQKLSERAELESILLSIYRRQPPGKEITAELLSRVSQADGDERLSLFWILGALGGKEILNRLRAAFGHDDNRSRRFDAVAAYLSWPDRSALTQLEELIVEGAGSDNVIRNKAIEAYSRISSLPAAVPVEEKIGVWNNALDWSRSVKDFRKVFIGAADNPSAETLALARKYEKDASQIRSAMARQAAAAIEKLTRETPTLEADGRLKPIDALVRQNAEAASGHSLRTHPSDYSDQSGPPRTVLTGWNSPDRWFLWHFKVKEDGDFGIEISQSAPDEGLSDFQIIIGDQALNGTSKQTSSWDDYETITLDGAVSLKAGKVHTLFLKAGRVIQPRMMEIESIHVSRK